MKLVIVRGPSGSGKSEFVEKLGGKLRSNYWHTELFWYELGRGHYHFNKDKVSEASEWCLDKIRTAMERGLPLIFFASAEPRRKGYEKYLELAEKFGYLVEVYRTKGPWHPETLFPDQPMPGKLLRKQISDYEQFPEELEAEMLDVQAWSLFTPGARTGPRPLS